MKKRDFFRPLIIVFFSLFSIYLITKIIDLTLLSTNKLQHIEYSLGLITAIIMTLTTITFLYLFIKKSNKSLLWAHLSAGSYFLTAGISYVQVVYFPSGNQIIIGPIKIFTMPIYYYLMSVAIVYWYLLIDYIKLQKNK